MPFLSESKTPTGSTIGFTGVLKDLENGKLKATLETTLGHELRHSYDYDQGRMAGEFGKLSSASDPAEIRAVNFENRIRYYDAKIPIRTTYDGISIQKNMLEDPSKPPKMTDQ